MLVLVYKVDEIKKINNIYLYDTPTPTPLFLPACQHNNPMMAGREGNNGIYFWFFRKMRSFYLKNLSPLFFKNTA